MSAFLEKENISCQSPGGKKGGKQYTRSYASVCACQCVLESGKKQDIVMHCDAFFYLFPPGCVVIIFQAIRLEGNGRQGPIHRLLSE